MNDQAVYDLQEYLRTLAKYHNTKPLVVPDGIYGAVTREAVRAFQNSAGLPPTGTVDLATWNAIYTAYLLALEDSAISKPIYPFETPLASGLLSQGDETNLVFILQIMLESLRALYLSMSELRIDGVYGPDTAENVRIFQATHGLPITGNVDKLTWNRIADAYNRTPNE